MIFLKDTHHVLVAYTRNRRKWFGDLGDLEDTVQQETVLVLRLHTEFNLASVADTLAVADNKLLPSLRAS